MKRICLTFIFLFIFSQTAFSYTNCQVKLNRIYVGDEGWVWLHFANGGSCMISSSDPDQKNTLSMAITALTTGNSMIVRYHSDNVLCTDFGRDDVRGVYLFGREL